MTHTHWEFRELRGDDSRGMGYVSRDGVDILHVGEMGLSKADNLAIGHLAAAAPTMYEALKECAEDLATLVEAYYAHTKDYPSESRRYERDMAPVLKARAAISKAKGSP